MAQRPKAITGDWALDKLRSYCAYQERSSKEVLQKLRNFHLSQNDIDHIILQLTKDDYLNEDRFAKAFVTGKFSIKKWGKVKIKAKLTEKGISQSIARQALLAIDNDEYFDALLQLAGNKFSTLGEVPSIKRKQKMVAFLVGKGYEIDLIWKAINCLE